MIVPPAELANAETSLDISFFLDSDLSKDPAALKSKLMDSSVSFSIKELISDSVMVGELNRLFIPSIYLNITQSYGLAE